MYNMSVYSNDEDKDKALDCHKLMEATVEISSYQQIGNMITFTEPRPEPTVRPVRFWPDHFLLGARPLLVNAWDWHLQRNR